MRRIVRLLMALAVVWTVGTLAGPLPEAPAAGPGPEAFRYQVDIEGPLEVKTIYRVDLAGEVLKKCASDFGDMRLIDAAGREIPYVMVDNYRPGAGAPTYAVKILDYSHDSETATVTMALPGKHAAISSLQLNIADRDFRKLVSLYGSDDRTSWHLITEGSIFDFSSQIDLRKTTIEMEPSEYRYYSLKIKDTMATEPETGSITLKYKDLDFSVSQVEEKKLRIDGIKALTRARRSATAVYDEEVFKDFKVSFDKMGNTVIILEAGLPFEKLWFDIGNDYYYRKVTVQGSQTGEEESYRYLDSTKVYSFPLSGARETKDYLERSTDKHRFYKFIVENKNNPLLEIRAIKLRWIKKSIYFVPLEKTDKCSLYLGSDQVNKPDYDLANFIHQGNWFQQDYHKLEAAAVRSNQGYSPKALAGKAVQIEKIVLVGVVVVLVIGLGFWLYKLLGRVAADSRAGAGGGDAGPGGE